MNQGAISKSPFAGEIDLLYPPDAEEFFGFLSRIVNDSIRWILEARNLLRPKIECHDNDGIVELAVVAGQTSFDLNEKANLEVDRTAVRDQLLLALEKMEAKGTDDEILRLFHDRINAWAPLDAANEKTPLGKGQ